MSKAEAKTWTCEQAETSMVAGKNLRFVVAEGTIKGIVDPKEEVATPKEPEVDESPAESPVGSEIPADTSHVTFDTPKDGWGHL